MGRSISCGESSCPYLRSFLAYPLHGHGNSRRITQTGHPPCILKTRPRTTDGRRSLASRTFCRTPWTCLSLLSPLACHFLFFLMAENTPSLRGGGCVLSSPADISSQQAFSRPTDFQSHETRMMSFCFIQEHKIMKRDHLCHTDIPAVLHRPTSGSSPRGPRHGSSLAGRHREASWPSSCSLGSASLGFPCPQVPGSPVIDLLNSAHLTAEGIIIFCPFVVKLCIKIFCSLPDKLLYINCDGTSLEIMILFLLLLLYREHFFLPSIML